MKKMIIMVFLVSLLLTTLGLSQVVIKHKNPNENLKSRWNWAFDQAKSNNYKGGFWVGYSIKRLMGERSFTGTFYDPPREELKALREILGMAPEKNRFDNVSDVEMLKKEAEKALERIKDEKKPEKKIWKDVAFLFRYSSTKRDFSAIEKMKFSNLSLVVELDELPLIWLDKAKDEESITFLKEIYPKSDKEKNKERIISAVSFHQETKLVIPFLKNKLEGKESVNIRKKAAFWLGQRDEKKALDVLVKAMKNDPSVKVREQVVFAISQMDLDAATDKLIDLAQNANDQAVKEKAIFWLNNFFVNKK